LGTERQPALKDGYTTEIFNAILLSEKFLKNHMDLCFI